MYNDPDARLMDVHDAIGGCFDAVACKCGCLFCVGDMINRLKRNAPLDSDMYFFASRNNGEFCVNVYLVEKANEKFRVLYPKPENETVSVEFMRNAVMVALEGFMKKEAIEKLRRDTLMTLFNRHVWKRGRLPEDMQSLIPPKR